MTMSIEHIKVEVVLDQTGGKKMPDEVKPVMECFGSYNIDPAVCPKCGYRIACQEKARAIHAVGSKSLTSELYTTWAIEVLSAASSTSPSTRSWVGSLSPTALMVGACLM